MCTKMLKNVHKGLFLFSKNKQINHTGAEMWLTDNWKKIRKLDKPKLTNLSISVTINFLQLSPHSKNFFTEIQNKLS